MERPGLAGALQAYRERAGLSKRALSQLAKLSPSYVGKLEAREIEPSVKAFLSISRALQLSQNDVVLCIRLALADFFPVD